MEEMSWEEFQFPAFVKPAYEGSSKGIRLNSKVETEQELVSAVRHVLEQYRQPALVEEFIGGDEVTVGVIGNRPPSVLEVMRVLKKDGKPPMAYSLEVKRDWETVVDYECPAHLDGRVLRRVRELSTKAFKALGCRDVARLDFRITPQGTPYFLEVNPLPGLNSYSGDLPIMARELGMSYRQLIALILESAMERYPLCIAT